jgi:CBS domain-containing protein
MELSKIMTKNVEIIHPGASVKEAAATMRSLNIGGLPVCDGDRLVGFVTDRDITVRTTAEGRDPTKTQVRDAMTPELVYCFEDQNVQEAARLMESKQMRRLPILSRAKRLVGIVSLGDLAVDAKLGGRVLKRVSERAEPAH